MIGLATLGALPPAGTLAGEAVRAAGVGALFLLVFAAGEAWRRWGGPRPEWTRKWVHFAGGMVCATLPWVLGSHWTVLALGVAFALIIWGTRRLGLLGSVHGVERKSEGGIYFPVAVYLLFLLTADRPAFYLASLLVLVVADAAAAIVGSEYGRRAYPVERDRRTLEGSAVFFLTAFLCVHLPLLLVDGTDPALSVAIGIQLALIVTLFEAISVRGNDNLVVPLVTYFLLVKMTPRPAEFIFAQLGAQLVIMALLGWLAWRWRFVTFSSALALVLVLYGAFSLGGPEWLVPPVMGILAFVAYRSLALPAAVRAGIGYPVGTIFYVGVVASALFVLNNAFETLAPGGFRWPVADPLYVPFVGVVAAHLAIISVALPGRRGERGAAEQRDLFVLAGPLVAFVSVVPLGLAVGMEGLTPAAAATAGAVCFGSLGVYVAVRRVSHWPRVGHWDARLQALSVAVLTVAVLPLHFWRIGVL